VGGYLPPRYRRSPSILESRFNFRASVVGAILVNQLSWATAAVAKRPIFL
jgi:hypothetical protein